MEPAYPGTAQHQRVLRQIVTFYDADPRILAVALFGSLTRGTWDQASDLDLDIVVADGVAVDALREVTRLCDSLATIGERALLIAPQSAEAADVVLVSLLEFSIRYHPLHTTSPNIVDSVEVLGGRLAADAIRAAGGANQPAPPTHIPARMDSFVRLALAVQRSIDRQQLWPALMLLEQMRVQFLEAWVQGHGGGRAYTVFHAHAPPRLHHALGMTLPQATLRSAQQCLSRLIALVAYEQDIAGLQHDLTPAQRTVLEYLYHRRQALRDSGA